MIITSADNRVWEPPPAGQRYARAPKYVAVIGCSGSGKSTAVRRLAGDAFDPTEPVIAIDERDTHHPYLDRLFLEPAEYAYELQLNFMLQRLLIIRRWQDAGLHIVMERSHHDDIIFARQLLATGLIDLGQFKLYESLWRTLGERATLPDAIVCLSVSADEAVRRVTADEQGCGRPKEFANEEQKHDWISAWSRRYDELFQEIVDDRSLRHRAAVFTETSNYETILEFVRERLSWE